MAQFTAFLLLALAAALPSITAQVMCPSGPSGVLCSCVESCCQSLGGHCQYSCGTNTTCARSTCSVVDQTTVAGECSAKCNYPVNATTTSFGAGYSLCHPTSNNTAHVKLYQLNGTCSDSVASETFTNLIADGRQCYHSTQMNYFTIECSPISEVRPNGNLPGFTLKGWAGPGCTAPSGLAQYTMGGPLDSCTNQHMNPEGYFSFGSNFTTGSLKVQCNLYGNGLSTAALHA